MPYRFLERNRIVSGLADAVVITEAAAQSGTLNTAAHALQQGKELFVVPGNITSPLSAGCNALLRQGAMPALSADDVLAMIAPQTSGATVQSAIPLGSTPLENDIIRLLHDGMRDGDAISIQLKADPAEFNMALTMLEINGIITPLGANQWMLR
jgi:DNA processing protein